MHHFQLMKLIMTACVLVIFSNNTLHAGFMPSVYSEFDSGSFAAPLEEPESKGENPNLKVLELSALLPFQSGVNPVDVSSGSSHWLAGSDSSALRVEGAELVSTLVCAVEPRYNSPMDEVATPPPRAG